jgi:hypothetical protein
MIDMSSNASSYGLVIFVKGVLHISPLYGTVCGDSSSLAACVPLILKPFIDTTVNSTNSRY